MRLRFHLPLNRTRMQNKKTEKHKTRFAILFQTIDDADQPSQTSIIKVGKSFEEENRSMVSQLKSIRSATSFH